MNLLYDAGIRQKNLSVTVPAGPNLDRAAFLLDAMRRRGIESKWIEALESRIEAAKPAAE
jgi:hypothetical protein